MFLTQQGNFITKPIAQLLGIILNAIYELLSNIGIINIGIAIILFTIVVRLLLFPLSLKQTKSSKIMNHIQPEIAKATKKYKGKKDQASVLAQQKITKEIQTKYGANMTTGCLTGLIQLPIFFSLYRVIQNIPAYVSKVYDLYSPIARSISEDTNAIENIKVLQAEHGTLSNVTLDPNNVDTIVDVLAKFTPDIWNEFSKMSDTNAGLISMIGENRGTIDQIYDFFSIHLTAAPGWSISLALIIPILSLIFQYLSMSAIPQQTPTDPTQQSTMNTMKIMNKIMPFFSFMVCISVPAGVGLYWATGSFIAFIISISTNYYFNHCDMEKIVEKSKEKAAKKNAKKKAKGKKSFMDKLQEAALGQTEQEQKKTIGNVATTSLKSYNSNTMKTGNANETVYRKDSLAARANAMQKYKDNNEGGKK